MNPQHVLFLKLTESTVGALPAERHSEFQFGIGESDMVGFALGVASAIVVPWLWRRLAKRPVPWAGRRTMRIYDIPERVAAPATLADQDSGDALVWGNCTRVPVSYEGN